jgi:transcriptional regulator with XRE-family HTH domain
MLSDADKLDSIMEFLGCRPAQLAAGLGRAPSEISFVLSGTRKLSAGIMLDLHDTYRISLDYLRKGEGRMVDSDEKILNEKENVIIEWTRRESRNLEILSRMVQAFLEMDRKGQKTRARKKKKKEKAGRR